VNRDEHGDLIIGQALLARATPFLAAAVGRRFRSTGTWAALQLLSRPDFYAEVRRVAELSDLDRVYLLLLPIDGRQDGSFRILPGDRIAVPSQPHPFLVRGERTLEMVALRTGVALESLLKENPHRFLVTPRSTVEFVHRRGGLRSRPGGAPIHRSRVVRIGETSLERYPSLPELLLHEAAHLGQDGSFEQFTPFYGPDGVHHTNEVLPWTSAYLEGWARYQSTHIPKRLARSDPVLPSLLAPTGSLWIEGAEAGRYLRLPPSRTQLQHYLGNEHAVSRILLGMEMLAGRETVEATFRRVKESPFPTLATHLAAVRRRRPSLAPRLERLLESEIPRAVGTPLLGRVLTGDVPDRFRDPSWVPEVTGLGWSAEP
jgi:hypothetical protein